MPGRLGLLLSLACHLALLVCVYGGWRPAPPIAGQTVFAMAFVAPSPPAEPQPVPLAKPEPVLPPLAFADVARLEQTPPQAMRHVAKPLQVSRKKIAVHPALKAAGEMPVAEPARSIPAQVAAAIAESSRGEVVNAYAQTLWRAIMARRPQGIRLHGIAVIQFVVAADGRLANAVILRSSESDLLDELALEGVREAGPFPPPPDGLSADERTFTIPFAFK